MYLTVPLPIAQHRQFKLQFVPRDPSQSPVRVRLLIPQNASFQKIKERVGSLLKVNPSHVRLTPAMVDCLLIDSLSDSTYGTVTITRGSTTRTTTSSVKILMWPSFTISEFQPLRVSGLWARLPRMGRSPYLFLRTRSKIPNTFQPNARSSHSSSLCPKPKRPILRRYAKRS